MLFLSHSVYTTGCSVDVYGNCFTVILRDGRKQLLSWRQEQRMPPFHDHTPATVNVEGGKTQ